LDLTKLQADWETDDQIKYAAFDTVEQLAAHLRKAHNAMMSGEHGCLGYLYKLQTRRLREALGDKQHVRRRSSDGE